MPIASGANGWPGLHRAWQRQLQSAQNSQTVFAHPQSRYVDPWALEGGYHSSARYQRPSPGQQYNGGEGWKPDRNGDCCGAGCGSECGPDGEAGDPCCYCGGSSLYSTGTAGANAGCCQGGLFSDKNPAYPVGRSDYTLQRTGRHRCRACVLGMLLALLLFGLVLGCVLALDPYLKREKAAKDYIKNHPGARQVGNYIVVPRETYIDYYKVNGAQMPCNPYNNGSELVTTTTTTTTTAKTTTSTTTTVVMPNFRNKRFVEINNDPSEYLLPDCDSLTTNIEWAYSVLVTDPDVAAAACGSRQTSIVWCLFCLIFVL